MSALLSLPWLERAIPAVARYAGSRKGERWLLAIDDPGLFAAGMLGLLSAGKTVVIPPNFLPEGMAALSSEIDGRLGPDDLKEVLDPRAPRGPGVSLEAILRQDGGRILLFTSGSTGSPQGIEKRFSQLTAETEVLEGCFGSTVGDATVVSTVPHHHIYGLLFRILWPLWVGRPCLSATMLFPGELLESLERHRRTALVTSPTFLNRLLRACDLSVFRGRLAAVFSSGGPLKEEDALEVCEALGQSPVEVFGSTETGGIAWRQRKKAGDDAWTPLPGVDLDAAPSGALRVLSPFTGGAFMETGDAVSFLPGGGFLLRGRIDRVVKIQEKRISLEDLENAIRGHSWVAQAAVVLLTGPRDELGAVVVLREGAPGENGDGKNRFRDGLRSYLAARFDSVIIPRRFRFVPELPCDERGKVTVEALRRLFQPGARGGGAAAEADLEGR